MGVWEVDDMEQGIQPQRPKFKEHSTVDGARNNQGLLVGTTSNRRTVSHKLDIDHGRYGDTKRK